MKNGKLRVALVGVSFGAEFIPIYLKHPDVDSLVLVDTNEKLLNAVGDKFLLEERLTDFNAMLEDKTIDAVHLVTPPATHAPLSIQVMNAGKHCACTIPMGMSIDELYQVIDARKRSGKHYMFMQNPLNTSISEVISTYVYKIGMISNQYSLSAAVNLFNTVINFVLLILVNGFSKKLGDTSLW